MKTFWKVLGLVGILMTTNISLLHAKEGGKDKSKSSDQGSQSLGFPNSTLSNINRIAAWYSDNGEQEREPVSENSGLTFPRLTSTAIYSAGIIWGGRFNDAQFPILRVNGQSYNEGTRRGRILGVRTGIAEDPLAPDVRIWRIRRDRHLSGSETER